MIRILIVLLLAPLAAPMALADDVSESERLLCSVSRVALCAETGDCFDVRPWEIGVPQFVVVDTVEQVISTTQAGPERRMTPIRSLERTDGLIILQGFEQGRAFSFLIDEATGLVTVAVSRDGVAVNVFGACTDAAVGAAGQG